MGNSCIKIVNLSPFSKQKKEKTELRPFVMNPAALTSGSFPDKKSVPNFHSIRLKSSIPVNRRINRENFLFPFYPE
jgi:hypothetical protein